MEILAKNLKELRLQCKFSQKEIAEKLGITYQSYQAYEMGKTLPNIIKLIQLADLYDVSIDYLVGRKDY